MESSVAQIHKPELCFRPASGLQAQQMQSPTLFIKGEVRGNQPSRCRLTFTGTSSRSRPSPRRRLGHQPHRPVRNTQHHPALQPTAKLAPDCNLLSVEIPSLCTKSHRTQNIEWLLLIRRDRAGKWHIRRCLLSGPFLLGTTLPWVWANGTASLQPAGALLSMKSDAVYPRVYAQGSLFQKVLTEGKQEGNSGGSSSSSGSSPQSLVLSTATGTRAPVPDLLPSEPPSVPSCLCGVPRW